MRLDGTPPSATSGFTPLTAHYVLVPLAVNKGVGLLREVACRESISSVRLEPLLLPGIGVAEPRLGRPPRAEQASRRLDDEVQDGLDAVPLLESGADHRMAVYGGYVRHVDEIINRFASDNIDHNALHSAYIALTHILCASCIGTRLGS